MKQKYFIHKFIRYFFIFSVPVIIMGIFLTIYSFFQIRQDSNTQVQSTFRISSQLMEEILTKGDDVADLMNTNSSISMSMYRILNQNSMDYKENITKNIMFYIFENLKSSSSYVDSVYVYFPNEEDYFFQTNRKLTSISLLPINSGWKILKHIQKKKISGLLYVPLRIIILKTLIRS